MKVNIVFEIDDAFGAELLTKLVETGKLPVRTPTPRKKVAKQDSIAIIFPELWGEKAQAGFYRWIEYRTKINKPLTDVSLQTQVNKFATQPKTFVALVDRAIANGWQGLNEQIPLDRSPTPKGLASQQGTIDAVAQILQECGHETRRD